MMRNERSAESSDTLYSSHASGSQDHLSKIKDINPALEEIKDAMAILAGDISGDISIEEVSNKTSLYTSAHHAQIRALSEETGRSREEIITAALTLYELALKAQAHNKKFGVVEPDQQLITEVGSL